MFLFLHGLAMALGFLMGMSGGSGFSHFAAGGGSIVAPADGGGGSGSGGGQNGDGGGTMPG